MKVLKWKFILIFSLGLIAACGDDNNEAPNDSQPPKSQPPAAQPKAVAPPAPKNVTASDIKPNAITISWSQSDGTKSYRVYKNGSLTKQTDSGVTQVVISEGIEQSTQYSFVLEACNDAGCSRSAPIKATTSDWPALNLKATEITSNSVKLSWDAISNMTYSVSQTSAGKEEVIASSIMTASYVVTGLSIDSSYQFSVKGCENASCTAQSRLTTQTQTIVPSKPGAITLNNANYNSVSISWGSVKYASNYQIKRDGKLLTQDDTSALTFIDDSVSGGTTYQYQVLACNKMGCSAPSELQATPPEQSIITKLDAVSVSTISLSWNAVQNKSHYRIYRLFSDGSQPILVATTGGQKYTIIDLTSATSYQFQIQACDTQSCQQQDDITVSTAQYQIILPSNITAVDTSVTTKTITLSWTPSARTDYYRLHRDAVLLAHGRITQSSFSDEQLTPNTKYIYTIKACNIDGCSAPKIVEVSTSALPTPTEKPQIPLPPTATILGSTKVLLSWKDDTSATSYTLFRNSVEVTGNIKTNSIENANLTKNTAYQYRINACNSIGCSDQSAATSITTQVEDLLTIKVTGFDAASGQYIPLNIYTQESAHSIFLDRFNKTYNNGEFIYSRKIYSNGRYGTTLRGSATNGQTCVSNKTGFNRLTGGQNVAVNINCETRVTFSFTYSTVQRVYQKNSTFLSLQPSATKTDGTSINAKAVLYSSSNEEVATVDENTGVITQHKPGNTQIRIRPKLGFYTASPVSYELRITDTNAPVVFQKNEVGQSIMQQPLATFQTLAPGAKTIVRAFFTALSSTDTTHPAVTAEISTDNKTIKKEMTCPNKAKVGPFDSPNYQKADACYAIFSKSESMEVIKPKMRLLIRSEDEQIQTSFPEVSSNAYIKLVMVPIKVNGQSQPMQTIQDIKDVIKRVMPLSQVNVTIREPYEYQGNYNGYPVETNDWGPFFTEIDQLRRTESDGKTHYYGMMPSRCFGVVGLGFTRGLTAIGIGSGCGSTSLKQTLIHELGHNLSLGHASCGTQATDPFWLNDDGWKGASKGQLSPEPLFDKKPEVLFATGTNGINNTDVMGYCGGEWLSKYHVNKISLYIANKDAYITRSSGSKRIANQNTHGLIVSGIIENNKVIMEPIILTDNTTYTENNGEYRMIFITESGTQIEHRFSPLQFDHEPNKLGISETIPVIQDIDKILFYHNEQLLDFELKGMQAQLKNRHISQFKGSVPIEIKRNVSTTDVIWNNIQYPWMTLIYLSDTHQKHVITLNKIGGNFTTDYFNDKSAGEIIVSVSDGLNNLQLKQSL